MYHDYYGLNRMPFQGSPDPDFVYLGPSHRDALATLEYGVEAGMGFILVTGEVGLGKTTLIRTFLQRARRPDLFVIYVFHPLLSFDALLAVMAEELGLPVDDQEPYRLVRDIQRDLIARFEDGQRVVLVIDEAHRLPPDTLENLRLISNLETDSAKLLQIVIIGQPELDALLAEPRLRQLDQRIALRARLAPLSRADSEAYIRHRLEQAGAAMHDTVLDDGAVREIAQRAGGVPRRINALADQVLIHGFGAGQRPVGKRGARIALRHAGSGEGVRRRPRRRRRWLVAACGLAAAVAGVAVFDPTAADAAVGWLRHALDQPDMFAEPLQLARAIFVSLAETVARWVSP
ncbi:MAG: AAA family ATPase [Alphaproteobacteria bacterium]|nr:AAA family ATPase [Alphaproteobacteria bacterium]